MPDYTRTITVNVNVPATENYFYSKAEAVDKYMQSERHGDGGIAMSIIVPAGYKVGLLKIAGTTDGNSAKFKITTRQSSSYVTEIEDVNVEANAPLNWDLPCWVPDQDVSDGTNANIVLYINGACGETVSLTCWYYLEEVS